MRSSFEFPELREPRPRAEADAEQQRLAAIESARAEGFAAGREAAREEIAPAVGALRSAAEALEAERGRAEAEAERAAAGLALQIAEKVLGTALEVRPELVLEAVRGALRRLTEPQESILLVNPGDADLVREALDGLVAEHGAALTVRAERRVERGGCIVRTEGGEVDARISEQLERARAVVEQELCR